MKGERRYALLGFLAWQLLKRQAKRRARRAVAADAESGGSGRGRAVVVTLAGLAAAAGTLFWWRSRESQDALPPS